MTTEPTPAASTNITENPAPALPSAAPTVVDAPAPVVPPPPETPPTWPIKADYAMLALLLILSFLLASFTATNSDLWTHLAIGKLYCEGKFNFGVDPFSWASEGVYWVHHSWLYSWLVYGIYSLFGGTGLVIGKAIIFTATIALLTRIGWNETNRWFVLICVLMAALALSHRILMQPLALSLLFLALTLFVLDQVGLFAFKRADAPPSPPAPLPEGKGGEMASAPRALLPQGEKGDKARWLWYLPALFALWANLDAWFILGPLLVALCWAATGLAKWFPSSNAVSGKTLGQVVGVSLLACLVNPHHVRVFQLPPELAYFLLAICDPIGIPLPNALVAAGRALKEMSAADAGALWTLSSLDPTYWRNPGLGLNAAGCAAGPLVLLGLVSFTLAALIKAQPNAPTLHAGRFLPWLLFAVMAVALYRLIPFFALVAAPLTAMTLGEFLQWQQVSNAVALARRDRGLNLARLVSVPFLLLLLFLAWPGWLGPTGGNEYSAARRVSWRLRSDPSMRRAAETLRTLHENKECANVFNDNFEMGNYLPWYAPGLKHSRDTRYALFAGQALVHTQARDALLDPGKPADDWQTLFAKHKVDQVVLSNLLLTGRIVRFWAEPEYWRQRFADNRVAVISWAGPGEVWPFDVAQDDGNRQAFGATVDRPPLRGTKPPEMLSTWTLYLDGIPPQPSAIGEINAHKFYHQLKRQYQPFHVTSGMQVHPAVANVLPTRSFMAFCVSAINVQAMPGGGLTCAPLLATLANEFKPVDYGRPALPVLMVRAGRQAAAENPFDAATQLILVEANDLLRAQEDYWAIPFGGSSEQRSRLRQFQMIAGHFNAAQLTPDQFDYNYRLGELYHQQQLFDLALEHMQLAHKALEAKRSSARDDPKKVDMKIKGFLDQKVVPLEKTVGLRLAKLKENTGSAPPLQKANYALNGKHQEMNQQTGRVEETRLGLGKKGLELVVAIDVKTLSDKDQQVYLPLLFNMLIEMGRADLLVGHLQESNIRKALPPLLLAQYQALAAGAIGDYEGMDEALRDFEKGLREGFPIMHKDVQVRGEACVASTFLVAAHHCPLTLLVNVAFLTAPQLMSLDQAVGMSNKVYNDLFNAMTLRGIAALEAGETKRALEIFEATLAEAGDAHFFSERLLARRYRDLLKQQVK